MSKKTTAPKKLNKAQTSKQLKEQEKEVARQRKLVKEVLYPFLISNTKSIAEAQRLCHEVHQSVLQGFQQKIAAVQKEVSDGLTSDIEFKDITNKGKDFKVNKALYDLLKDEKLSVFDALIGGMGNVIGSFVQEENTKRELSTLKTAFL